MKKTNYMKLLFLSTSILAFNTIAIDSAEASTISGTITMLNGSTLNVEQGTTVSSTGKIINETDQMRVYKGANLEIEAGTNGGTVDDATGVVHNHGTFTIYTGSKVTGGGKIINYGGFNDDVTNTGLASSSGDDGYQKDNYDSETTLTTSEKLAKATYYDLVNDTNITTFKAYGGGKLVGTTAETPDDSSGNTENIISSDGTYVDSNVIIENYDENPLIQKSTDANTAYNMGSAKTYTGNYTTIYSSDSNDEVKGSFFSADGYTQYANRVINGTGDESTDISSTIVPVPDDATKFKFGLQSNTGDYGNTTYSYTPVYIPAVDDSAVIRKTVPSGSSLSTYEEDLKDALNPDTGEGAFEFSDWTNSDPVTTYSGDNSWFNGVLKVDRGAVIVPNTAGMFGGRVEIGEVNSQYATAKEFHAALNSTDEAVRAEALNYAKNCNPTEFEWQGGAKDEYNRPDIYMNGNASLYFNLQPDEDGNQIFSLYGNITGSEEDRLIFQDGTIFIKGDCSGYKGRVAVSQGGKFEVRSSDAGSSSTYSGKFPNANIYQIDSNGALITNPDLETEVDTNSMENVTVNNGHILLKNSEGGVTLTSSTLAKGAMLTLAGVAEIIDFLIYGVTVATMNTIIRNVKIAGGVFVSEGTLSTENMEAGSTIALWGNNKIDRAINISGDGTGGSLTITDGHTLKLYNDFDFSSGTSDQINTLDTTVVNSGKGVQIGGMNFISNPTADEYTFTVLTGAATVTPITIGAVYNEAAATFVAYQNATFNSEAAISIPDVENSSYIDSDTVYTYTINSGTQLQTSLNNGVGQVTINGVTYYVYGSDIAGAGNVLMTRMVGGHAGAVESMHLTGLGAVSSIYGLISDDYGYKDKKEVGKYSFWNKTFAESDKYNTSSSDIKSKNWGTIFGFDAKPMALSKFNSEFMPTIFGGITHRNMKFGSYKANQDGYIFGGKGVFFNEKSCLELFASYEFLKTHSQKGSDKTNIKSHLFSFGTKFGYNFKLNKNWALRPNLLADYTFVKTPNTTTSGTVSNSVSTKNMNKFDIVPGMNLNGEFGQWAPTIFVAYHRNFGTKAQAKINSMQISNIDVTKNHYVEYGLGINRRIKNDNGNISLKLSRKTNGIKGFKFSLNAGIKF